MGLTSSHTVPDRIRAAVYRGQSRIGVEQVECPAIGAGELLVRVATCGICNTDVKKITANLLPPPRIYGHETAGTVVAAGEGVEAFRPGDRVAVFHHIPCRSCFYCERGLYAQCPTYKRVGITAGFEPAGGGFAEYVRVMDWITTHGGVEKIPDGITFHEATFIEPLNTVLKAVRTAQIGPGSRVLIFGQGIIGILFLLLAKRAGAAVCVSDMMDQRLERSRALGAEAAFNPQRDDLAAEMRALTQGHGPDVVIVAAAVADLIPLGIDIVRPGGKVLLFAQTSRLERVPIPTAAVCMDEKQLIGSYSSDFELQAECARIVFARELPLTHLITHRFPLSGIEEAIRLAANPRPDSLKIVVDCDA